MGISINRRRISRFLHRWFCRNPLDNFRISRVVTTSLILIFFSATMVLIALSVSLFSDIWRSRNNEQDAKDDYNAVVDAHEPLSVQRWVPGSMVIGGGGWVESQSTLQQHHLEETHTQFLEGMSAARISRPNGQKTYVSRPASIKTAAVPVHGHTDGIQRAQSVFAEAVLPINITAPNMLVNLTINLQNFTPPVVRFASLTRRKRISAVCVPRQPPNRGKSKISGGGSSKLQQQFVTSISDTSNAAKSNNNNNHNSTINNSNLWQLSALFTQKESLLDTASTRHHRRRRVDESSVRLVEASEGKDVSYHASFSSWPYSRTSERLREETLAVPQPLKTQTKRLGRGGVAAGRRMLLVEKGADDLVAEDVTTHTQPAFTTTVGTSTLSNDNSTANTTTPSPLTTTETEEGSTSTTAPQEDDDDNNDSDDKDKDGDPKRNLICDESHMQQYCEALYGDFASFVGSSYCREGTCGDCYYYSFLSDYCLVVQSFGFGTAGYKVVADAGMQSCRYPFTDGALYQNYTWSQHPPTSVTVRVYKRDDPWLALQEQTRGTCTFLEENNDQTILYLIFSSLSGVLTLGILWMLYSYMQKHYAFGTNIFHANAQFYQPNNDGEESSTGGSSDGDDTLSDADSNLGEAHESSQKTLMFTSSHSHKKKKHHYHLVPEENNPHPPPPPLPLAPLPAGIGRDAMMTDTQRFDDSGLTYFEHLQRQRQQQQHLPQPQIQQNFTTNNNNAHQSPISPAMHGSVNQNSYRSMTSSGNNTNNNMSTSPSVDQCLDAMRNATPPPQRYSNTAAAADSTRSAHQGFGGSNGSGDETHAYNSTRSHADYFGFSSARVSRGASGGGGGGGGVVSGGGPHSIRNYNDTCSYGALPLHGVLPSQERGGGRAERRPQHVSSPHHRNQDQQQYNNTDSRNNRVGGTAATHLLGNVSGQRSSGGNVTSPYFLNANQNHHQHHHDGDGEVSTRVSDVSGVGYGNPTRVSDMSGVSAMSSMVQGDSHSVTQ